MNALKALSIGTISLLSTVAYAQASHAISLSITDAGAGSSTFTFSGSASATSNFTAGNPAATFAFDVDPNNFLNDTTGFFGTAFTPTSGSVSFSTPSGNFAISQIFLTDASGVGNLDALDFRVPNFGVDSGETISILGGTASFDVPVDFGAFNTGTFNATAFAAPFEFQSQEITVGAAPGASVPFEFSPGLGLLAVGGLIGGSRVLKRRKDIIK